MSYERLEFLGDSILALAITGWLYRQFPEFKEGHLSQSKSILQGNSFLARKFIRRLIDYNERNRVGIKISQVLINESPHRTAVDQLIPLFKLHESKNDFEECFKETVKAKEKGLKRTGKHCETLSDECTLNLQKYKNVADLYESFIAALYIDNGFDIQVIAAVS